MPGRLQTKVTGDLNGSPEWGYDAVQRAVSPTCPTARIRGFSPHGA
jgi:hypothetical protein